MILKKIVLLLNPEERRQGLLVVGLALLAAFVDACGVGSVMPFIAILTTPDLISNNQHLAVISRICGLTDQSSFLLWSATLVFVLLCSALFLKALATYVQIRFALAREFTLSKRLVEVYLSQPYEWFLSRHSADLGKTVLAEVSQVVHGAILPMLSVVAQGITAAVLLLLLLVINPVIAAIVILTFGLAYAIFAMLLYGYLGRLGKARVSANKLRFTGVAEAFGAVKEIKVSSLEDVYISRFTGPAAIFARAQASGFLAAILPRYAIEGIAFGGLLLVAIYMMTSGGDLSTALPLIGLYAFAGLRLMPSAQGIYAGLSLLRASTASLDELSADLSGLSEPVEFKPDRGRMPFKVSLSLRKITYRYPKSTRPALDSVDLVITPGVAIGVAGATGSGKTTLLDIVLGLIDPQFGEVLVDGVRLDSQSVRKWQNAIGYVPQHIYLSSGTISQNIAFGVSDSDIDKDRVVLAAKVADLHDVIVRDLPAGYESWVGERGNQLSGGQRQRIGIARAIYRDPRILVFDEATSAQDVVTERRLLANVRELGKDLTIIMVAHRLATLQICDQIIFMDNGRLVARGCFEELVETSVGFREMAFDQS